MNLADNILGAGLAIFALIVLGVLLYPELSETLNQGRASQVSAVSQAYEEQYQTLVNTGASDVELCVRAGLVKESYLQSNDDINYAKWNFTHIKDCDRAGVPR